MDYITIVNDGHIVKEDLFLIGASTKRGDSSKIGMFGSGWKFALAWFMRNDCKITIWSGKEEIKVDTEIVKHRDNDVKVITIDGVKTSLTTEMGHKWNGWMAIREMVANAIDEGGFDLQPDSNIIPENGKTTLYIGINSELKEVMFNYNQYFSFDRPNGIRIEPINGIHGATFYLKTRASEMTVYRKGIKCSEGIGLSYYDIDLDDVDISEDRIADRYDIERNIGNVMLSDNLTFDVLFAVLKLVPFYNKDRILTDYPNTTIINLLVKGYADGKRYASELLNKLLGKAIIGNRLIIPNSWYNKLVKDNLIPDEFEQYFSKGIPSDFVLKDALFDITATLQYVRCIFPNMTIISGVFAGDYESIRVVDDTVYVKWNYNYTADEIAASIILRTPRSHMQDRLKTMWSTIYEPALPAIAESNETDVDK